MMNAPTVRNKFVLDEIDLDSPKFSICPSCASQVIKLVDGCSVCGWSEEDKKLLGGLNKSSSNFSSTIKNQLAIPCTIQYPRQSAIKGVIQQDFGNCFVVNISKLFVYPDFSKSVEQIDNHPRKNLTPSKESPRKKRRQNGEGNGSIHYRIVTKNNKEYTEAYYHYIENGRKRTKYIPKKLLNRVEELVGRRNIQSRYDRGFRDFGNSIKISI